MNFKTGLLLRQKVPKDKERITFDTMYEIDDMWIWLFYMIHSKLKLEHSEVWMHGGGPRVTRYEDNFVERWYETYPIEPRFDIIFSRGGFKEYIPVMQANSQAIKLYYGAIYKARFNPKASGDTVDYNIVLADSQSQYDELKQHGYNVIKYMELNMKSAKQKILRRLLKLEFVVAMLLFRFYRRVRMRSILALIAIMVLTAEEVVKMGVFSNGQKKS
ncbi:unnamed protein product [marine sediment metagenome]|uniref:Uncharacterized protein n=1 Tax=marine sediment metagenome TaxID=412755 RepID=X1D9W3_9ZZZZ